MQDSVPQVIEDDEIDLSDVDNTQKLTHFEHMLILLEKVREEHGPITMDSVCMAELRSMWWAITRRRRLEAIHRVRAYKRKHRLSRDGSGETLARRGVKDVQAAREWFARCGIPIMEAVQ